MVIFSENSRLSQVNGKSNAPASYSYVITMEFKTALEVAFRLGTKSWHLRRSDDGDVNSDRRCADSCSNLSGDGEDEGVVTMVTGQVTLVTGRGPVAPAVTRGDGRPCSGRPKADPAEPAFAECADRNATVVSAVDATPRSRARADTADGTKHGRR
jgi:hypothetical protein